MTKRQNDTSPGDWNDFWTAQLPSGSRGVSWSKKRIMAILDRYVREGMAVLDAGCGSGFFSAYFISKGCRTYALDYSPDALEMARTLTQGKAEGYLKEDLVEESFGEAYRGRFDLIFTDGLLEHFDEADKARIMTNFISALAPDGTIVNFCPNRYSPWQLIRPFYMPGIKEVPFTSGGMRRLHEGSGLDILEEGGINVLPVRLSPDRALGGWFGMLLYCVARKKK